LAAAPLYSIGGVGANDGGRFEFMTNASAQILARSRSTATNAYFATAGWIDRRGRDD
jgi:hypothetical protein